MIYVILGTMGEYIKMFPVMKLFDQQNIDYKLIHTCQHYGIIEKNRKRFKARKPDIYLTLKKKDLANIWEFLLWAPRVLFNARKLPITKNDFVIVQGDAESTLLGFIIGKFFRAKIAHVEAGIRSGDFLEPFAEEIIRTVVSRFSDVCFCPSEKNAKTIKGKKRVFVTNGNTVLDSARLAHCSKPSLEIEKLKKKRPIYITIHGDYSYAVYSSVIDDKCKAICVNRSIVSDKPMKYTVNGIRSKLNPPIIYITSRLENGKMGVIDRMIELIREDKVQYKVVVQGNGVHLPKYREDTQDIKDKIEFAGAVSNIKYNQQDIVIGVGRVYLEGKMSGCRCIIANDTIFMGDNEDDRKEWNYNSKGLEKVTKENLYTKLVDVLKEEPILPDYTVMKMAEDYLELWG